MKSLSGNIKVASDAKKAMKPSMSFLAKASLAPAFRCLISSRREVDEVWEECIHPVGNCCLIPRAYRLLLQESISPCCYLGVGDFN